MMINADNEAGVMRSEAAENIVDEDNEAIQLSSGKQQRREMKA